MILQTAKDTRNKIAKELNSATNKCATIDVWSDSSRSVYLGATIHFLTTKFEMQKFFIGLHLLENGTAAKEIRTGFEALLSKVKCNLDEIDFVTTDNGSNVVAVFKQDAQGIFVVFFI